ncbi:TetR/AcrR family transcriptional regulator [Amycolatopsis viridis]|uniref:AcrR family transcriptional regulator n=1 Tax=Amycolatopsis viridis TaxID=185678 RepID=A0ABX0SYY9_9PSEU|nr:TetR/AcrR family transcriptional regulator [Amycolatopsis viridis]NIH81609.1 AcrR family transcriptional regulator [Amycolatopsis viridis]
MNKADRVDPRVARTRVLLQTAALELAAERDLDKITIAHVAERATINRATVYQHYRDRDELFLEAMEGELTALTAVVARCPLTTMPDEMPQAMVGVFQHVEANLVLYQRMLGPCGSARFIDRLHRLVAEAAVQQLTETGTRTPDNPEVQMQADCSAGAFIGLLRHWLLGPEVQPAERAAATAWRALVRSDRR